MLQTMHLQTSARNPPGKHRRRRLVRLSRDLASRMKYIIPQMFGRSVGMMVLQQKQATIHRWNRHLMWPLLVIEPK
jgi:hypothetical protein